MMSLTEKYRPQSLDDVIGNTKAVQSVRRQLAMGLPNRAVWISGPSGTGKTTIARIIAGTVADRFCVDEIDAGSLTADKLREWMDSCRLYGWGKGGRAFIVNEAHGLNARIIRTLLVWLEELPAHVVVIFTTTRAGEEKLFEDQIDASPLLSRCFEVTLSNQGLAKPFAARALEIARAEGLDGQPIEKYERLLKDESNNMRGALQKIQAGVMLAEA